MRKGREGCLGGEGDGIWAVAGVDTGSRRNTRRGQGQSVGNAAGACLAVECRGRGCAWRRSTADNRGKA